MVLELTNDNFNVFINNDLVLVDFKASWCMPCRYLEPELLKVSNDGYLVGSIDIEKYKDIADKYNISNIPALCIFINGKLEDVSIGYRGYKLIKEFIKAYE